MSVDFNTSIGVTFYGRDANQGVLNVYDYARSISGLTRTSIILAEYYTTGKIVHKAPSASVEFFAAAPEEGSFKQTIYATVAAGICAAPFATFANRAMDSWLPSIDPQIERLIALQEDQNELLERLIAEGEKPISQKDLKEIEVADEFIKENSEEIGVIRSITSNSFRDIYRPVDRSCEFARVFAGSKELPTEVVTPRTAALLESDRLDPEIRTISARVTGFTRSSKKGVCFSQNMGRGFKFEYAGKEGNLPSRDIFSWSQYEQKDIILEGQFVYFFDGGIKKMIVLFANKAAGS